MDIRKWIVAYFSPTGGTKKVADAIAAGFGTPITEVDLTKAVPAMTPAEGEALMAVLPVYAGRVPKIALDRLSAIKGRGHKAVAVVVYGNREFDDGLLETKKHRALRSSQGRHLLQSIPLCGLLPPAVPMERTRRLLDALPQTLWLR